MAEWEGLGMSLELGAEFVRLVGMAAREGAMAGTMTTRWRPIQRRRYSGRYEVTQECEIEEIEGNGQYESQGGRPWRRYTCLRVAQPRASTLSCSSSCGSCGLANVQYQWETRSFGGISIDSKNGYYGVCT
jgi:hypothetical protein